MPACAAAQKQHCSRWRINRVTVHAWRWGYTHTCYVVLTIKYKADPNTWLQGRLVTLCSSSAQEIISSKQADHSARWLATIQLKNTITRHWRQRSDSRQRPRRLTSALPSALLSTAGACSPASYSCAAVQGHNGWREGILAWQAADAYRSGGHAGTPAMRLHFMQPEPFLEVFGLWLSRRSALAGLRNR